MLSIEDQTKIADFLVGKELCEGVGTAESMCSIAAINLALTGRLTDDIPDCMSLVIGKWIISVQDAMPAAIRNSDEWRNLLPLAAGTGRDRESERLAIILNWMWADVLPSIQAIADQYGFGGTWGVMCQERTPAAAAAAADAADAAAAAAADAADAAADAADVARAYAAYAARADAADAAYAAAYAARAAAYAARAAEKWQQFNPCALLKRLVECGA